MKTRKSVQPANTRVRQHQRNDEDQSAAQRIVRPGDGGLEGIGDQQDEDQVVERERPDLSLAEDAQRNQKRDVDQNRANDQLPGRNARQQG